MHINMSAVTLQNGLLTSVVTLVDIIFYLATVRDSFFYFELPR